MKKNIKMSKKKNISGSKNACKMCINLKVAVYANKIGNSFLIVIIVCSKQFLEMFKLL